ncbi:hypothetical protein SAMN05421548_11156 [Paraburkholderia lycopersici]|uniref:Uncharacterized protein n=1 Tax=Paraburkholderia lycopersici TaxID=416944 RepID=A0A1G6Q1M2_9BURK|nr:hypothetical protein SAMN05421548_11156 [Paraburkholderia lycopersici]
MLTRDGLPEAVREVLKRDFREIGETLNRRNALGGNQDHASDALHLERTIRARIEEAPGTFGWLVQASQREFRVEDNGELHFPWQPVRTAWIHAPTYERAVGIACAWAEDYCRQAWGEGDQDACEND